MEDTGGDASALGLILILLFFLLLFVGIVALIVVVFRHVLRRNKERVAALQTYAQERGLTYEGDGRLPRVTPLLKRGGGGALGIVSGRIGDGLDGKLAGYRYTTGSGDSRQIHYYTVALAPLPEAGSAELYCYRRTGGGLFDGVVGAVTRFQPVELESEDFNDDFMLMVKDEANMLAIRQLFSPSFIVFLSEHVPLGFWFELDEGHLMGAIKGEHWDEPAVLDEVCAATAAIAQRFRADISERAGLRGATQPPPPAQPPPQQPPQQQPAQPPPSGATTQPPPPPPY